MICHAWLRTICNNIPLIRFWRLNTFQQDITSAPGIGAATATKLAAECEGDSPVTTTYQLIGKFLSLKGQGMTTKMHCDAMWHWLNARGINSHRAGIVHAIAERTEVMMPGIYNLVEDDDRHKLSEVNLGNLVLSVGSNECST